MSASMESDIEAIRNDVDRLEQLLSGATQSGVLVSIQESLARSAEADEAAVKGLEARSAKSKPAPELVRIEMTETFAMVAMQGMLARRNAPDSAVVRESWAIADLMVEEALRRRDARHGPPVAWNAGKARCHAPKRNESEVDKALRLIGKMLAEGAVFRFNPMDLEHLHAKAKAGERGTFGSVPYLATHSIAPGFFEVVPRTSSLGTIESTLSFFGGIGRLLDFAEDAIRSRMGPISAGQIANAMAGDFRLNPNIPDEHKQMMREAWTLLAQDKGHISLSRHHEGLSRVIRDWGEVKALGFLGCLWQDTGSSKCKLVCDNGNGMSYDIEVAPPSVAEMELLVNAYTSGDVATTLPALRLKALQ